MERENILIVEDENDCAELLRYHLQKENYQTEIASNGKEAIEAVQRHMPDVVLLDVMMPELNGWEVCRILRESTQGKSLPIIMLTALSDEEERVKGLSLGADDYLAKPYSVKELLLKIRKHIDRQQTVKQFMSREREQDTALRCLVHELRGPLHVIGGFSSHALRQEDSNKYLKTINTAARHAESLLHDAPLLSRIKTKGDGLSVKQLDSGPVINNASDSFYVSAKTKVSHKPVNAISLISEIAETTRVLIGGKPISVEVMAPATDVIISTDNVRLTQILTNLVSNAVKFTEQGAIVISLCVSGGWMELTVSDTGIGIREEDLHKLFTTNCRIEDAKTNERGGMGLGLAISKNLTQLLGGTITVTSIFGKGSAFVVSLPLQPEDKQRGLYKVE